MRNSSIELLRIILFVMVVTIHVTGPYLSSHTVSGVWNWQFANLMDGGSRVAVVCFVILTGYLSCVTKEVKPRRQILRALSPIAWYLPIYLILFMVDNPAKPARAITAMVQDLVYNRIYFYHFWYVQVLLVFYLLMPYLNLLIAQLDSRHLRHLVFVFFFFASVIPTVVYLIDAPSYDLSLFSSRIALFVLLYLIGAYLRLHMKTSLSFGRLLFFFACADLVIVGMTFLYNSRYSPLIFFARLRGITITYPFGGVSGAFYEINSSPVVVAAALLVAAFTSLSIPVSTWINRVGALTYGAYVVHVFWIIVLSRFINPFAAADSSRYPLIAITLIACVAICSLVTETVRQQMLRWLTRS